MSEPTISIGGLRIRASTGTLSPADGQRLGERVGVLMAERLAEHASGGGLSSRATGTIRVRVQARRDDNVDSMAAQVVDAVMRMIQR